MRQSTSVVILASSISLLLLACGRETNADSGSRLGAASPLPELRAVVAKQDPLYRVPIEDLPSFGGPNAPVTVVVFTDYQCPFCRRADDTIAKLRAEYPDDLRVVVAVRPLPMHNRARPAALAALAAAQQGRFEQMHARLFGDADSLDDASIVRIAKEVGLDIARFKTDWTGAAIDAQLARAEALADRLGVAGTPTFFSNGQRVSGAPPIATFRRVIEERRTAARALMTSGVKPSRVYEASIASGAERVMGDAPAGSEVVAHVPIDGAPSRGATTAAITIVAFEDFECGYCVRAEPTIQAIEKAHPGQVRVVYKHHPLPMHSFANLAARASLAAAEQGQFWGYHDVLFAHQDALDRASLERYAAVVGLDVTRFVADLDDPRLKARLDADEADAEKLSVTGTPTFFVNGWRIVGAQPFATFEAAIAKR
ncbi:MAG: hypothetical protein NVSMB1_10980 [Polyangiales bacterium]